MALLALSCDVDSRQKSSMTCTVFYIIIDRRSLRVQQLHEVGYPYLPSGTAESVQEPLRPLLHRLHFPLRLRHLLRHLISSPTSLRRYCRQRRELRLTQSLYVVALIFA